MRPLAALAALSVALVPALAMAAGQGKPENRRHQGRFFTITLPAGWSQLEGADEMNSRFMRDRSERNGVIEVNLMFRNAK